MDAIEKKLLEEVADLHGIPEGAYNIRADGKLAGRNTTAHINIVTKEDKPGIDIYIAPGTKNESVHIPVIISQTGLKDMVYNDFYIGEDCDVDIVGSCGIHIAPVYGGAVAPVVLRDEIGPVYLWLLPFLKPAHVRRWFPDAQIESYTDAVAAAIAHMDIDDSARNVLVTHQFVTGGARSGSEELSVGGTDNVDSSVFAPFDYVALGHLHGAQQIGRPTIRYAGSPLKYSFSEASQRKSVTVVTLGEKSAVDVRTVPLTPLRDLREIRGSYDELTARSFYEHTTYRSDYLHLILTDEQDVFDAVGRLRAIYPYLMTLDYDNARTRAAGAVAAPAAMEQRTPLELFEALYLQQNNQPMSDEQRAFAAQLMEEIQEAQP